MVSNSDQISVFINGFNMMILCYLGQKDSLLNVGGKVLLLRLINNLVVSYIKFAESLKNINIIIVINTFNVISILILFKMCKRAIIIYAWKYPSCLDLGYVKLLMTL